MATLDSSQPDLNKNDSSYSYMADPEETNMEHTTLGSSHLEEGEIEALDPNEFIDPHPLNSKWTLYYTNPSKSGGVWKSSVNKILELTTVEEFWGLFNHLPSIDQLTAGSDFNFFREDIFPEWEDPRNKKGGKWTCIPHDNHQISEYWLNSCLFAIGEMFEDTSEICGIVASVRSRGFRLCLWTKTAYNESKTKALGKAWKEALGLSKNETISYQPFYNKDGGSSDNRDIYHV